MSCSVPPEISRNLVNKLAVEKFKDLAAVQHTQHPPSQSQACCDRDDDRQEAKPKN